MDQLNQPKNDKTINKTTEKRTHLNDLKSQKDGVLKAQIRPYSNEIDIDLNNFGN